MRLLIAAALATALPAAAQTAIHNTPPDGYIFKPAAQIDATLSTSQTGPVSVYMNDHENYFIEFVKRQDHGNVVEVHPHGIDQITILAGEGTLTFGGTVAGGTTSPTGEVRGGTQVGAITQAVHPGDFVLIPAGSAHKFDAAPGKMLTYVVAKARS